MNSSQIMYIIAMLPVFAVLGCGTFSKEVQIKQDWTEWKKAAAHATVQPRKFESVPLADVLSFAEKEMNRTAANAWTFGLYQVDGDMRSITDKEAEENISYSADFQAEFPLDTFLESVEYMTRTSYTVEGRKVLFGKAF